MTNTLNSSRPIPQLKNRRILPVLVIPLLACMISSIVGILLGQIGNIIYKILGESAKCLAIPGFCGLFLVSFGLSFFTNKLLRKRLVGS
jgi:small neutral amino acid transporter SnatA (MarC family)